LIEDQINLQLQQKVALHEKMQTEGTGDPEMLDRLQIDIKKLEHVTEELTDNNKKMSHPYPKRDS
jgi:hypothetical protein